LWYVPPPPAHRGVKHPPCEADPLI
jgi:hypothetical protein